MYRDFFFTTSSELKDDKTLWGGQRQGAGGHLYTFCSTCMHSVGIRAFSAFVFLIQIEASSISLHNDEENLRDRHFAVCSNFTPCLSARPVFLPSWAFAMIRPSDLTFCFDTPCHSSSSLISHKDSVSPVGGGAREDLRHAWPHHAGERHQGSDHALRPGWPWTGGYHRLGQTHPRYNTNCFFTFIHLLVFI